MIVIFGWSKDKRRLKTVLSCYCYVCQRPADWELRRETEWATFFGVRTVPFLSRHFLGCSRCGDEAPVARAESLALMRGDGVEPAKARLEKTQLAGKSEVQRNFLVLTRRARESASARA